MIAVDTSGSCSGPLVERFVSTTYGILKSENVIRKNTKIYVIECDHVIQRVSVVNKSTDIDGMFSNFSPKGFGGTDFRPVFEYVNDLIMKRDGLGIYPRKKPSWRSVFVYSSYESAADILKNTDQTNEYTVPSWVIKYTLKDGMIK